VLYISSLLVSRLLLAIRLLLIVACTAIATLLRIAASVVALLLVSGVRVVEGTLAGLRVNENVAILALVPFGIPWRWQRRALRLWLRMVEHLDFGFGVEDVKEYVKRKRGKGQKSLF
jgi:hypothetical protein